MPKFVPRERKHRRLQRNRKDGGNAGGAPTSTDSNAIEILPSSFTEKMEKKQKMKADLKAQQPKMSAKKQKRLDKYIDKKLQKEENLDFIKRLAGAKVDTSSLQSSRSLGNKKVKRELTSRTLDKAKIGNKDDGNHGVHEEDESSEITSSDLSDISDIATDSRKPSEKSHIPVLGSGLKRSLDSDGIPVIRKRQRLSKARPSFQPEIELPWEGFDSDGASDRSQSATSSTASSSGPQTESDQDSEVSDESEPPSSDNRADDDEKRERKERSSAFKAWATEQMHESLGFTPSSAPLNTSEELASSDKFATKIHSLQPRPPEIDPLPPELEINPRAPERQAYHVDVVRSAEVQEARLGLPVVAEEQKIMEAIYNNPTTVIWGATGSGKTTQVPQFLFEAGYGTLGSPNPGMIGVTQPRRVAAVSVANRVAHELGEERERVSYQIRFDSSVSNKTAIKFMTDGILIREIANDFALQKYSVIVIDEAHERSANTDILIGMVSRIVDLRASMSKDDPTIKPLKMVIMSATLRVTDFLNNPNLFRSGAPPLVQAEGRQFPVTTHFARRTQRDYVDEVFTRVSRGHKKLPPGGMLVFLTGQNEITVLAKRLREAFANTQGSYPAGQRVHLTPNDAPIETEDLEVGKQQYEAEDDDGYSDTACLDDEGEDEFNTGDSTPASTSVHVLPLYSQLQTKDQLRVFEPPPANARMIVLATNVAETSLTIPGIRYVFDTGRSKEKKYDQFTGVQSFEVGWISKASASQRAGRAGRTGPGHCYRLYSSAVYERDFDEHAEPEILRMPAEGVVLQLKSMDLQHIVNFPFPTPPDRQSLAKAEKLLQYLGGLSPEGKVTVVGRELSNYPLSPRFSKMLTIGHQHGCLSYTIALVAALATPNLYTQENQLAPPSVSDIDDPQDKIQANLQSAYRHAHHLFSRHSSTSDALKALTALCAYAYAPPKDDFCREMFLSPKAIAEASNLSSQLMAVVRNNNPTLLPPNPSLQLPSPSKTQTSALQQITAAAFIDQIAIRFDAHPSPPEIPRKPTRPIDVPYVPLFSINGGRRSADTDIIDIAVFIHPSSVLAHLPVKQLPTYIVYAHLQRGTPSTIEGGKRPRTRMHALGAVSGKQIAGLAKGTPLLAYGKPIGKIEEVDGGMRRCWVVPSLVGEKGGMGWPLPAQKVLQKRDKKGEWVIEKIIS
ncbi:putative ATP-dependent RNA helicase DHR1 [Lecanora helva]